MNMPNWANNKVHMRNIGINKKLYSENGEFDFNTIIPMPETIYGTVSGSITDIAIELVMFLAWKRYEHYSNIGARMFGVQLSDWDLLDQNPDLKNKVLAFIGNTSSVEEQFNNLIKTGVIYIYNMCMYQHPEWYDWSCRNWSTKWNASETKIIDKDCIEFNTAWNIPDKVFIALSEIYPYDEIIVDWMEEGGYCGVASYHGGEKIQDNTYIMDYDSLYDLEKDEPRNRLFCKITQE